MPKSDGIASGVSILLSVSLSSGIWLPEPAHAQAASPSWQGYEVPTDAHPVGARHYIDVQSLTKRGTLRQAWTMVRPLRAAKFDNDELHAWMSLVEVDCSARSERGLREIGYGSEGRRLYQARSAAPLVSVMPNSLGHARLQAICGIP